MGEGVHAQRREKRDVVELPGMGRWKMFQLDCAPDLGGSFAFLFL